MMKRDDGKKQMEIKGPSKKRTCGIEENNVLVPVGGLYVILREFSRYLYFTIQRHSQRIASER